MKCDALYFLRRAPIPAHLANYAIFAQNSFIGSKNNVEPRELGSMWRAKIKISSELDRKIRDHAVRNTTKLRALVEELIDEGAEVISSQGADYIFEAHTSWPPAELAEVEYVLGDEYRAKIDGLTAAMKGAGKRGKALAETLHIAARDRGIS